MKLALTHSEIKMARNALSLLGSIPPTPVDRVIVPEGYSRVKNLKLFSRIIKDEEDLANELFAKAVEKDEEDNPKLFEKVVPGKDGETKESRITDKKALKDFNDEMEKLNKKKHDVEVLQVPYDRFKKYIEEKGIDSNILAPLLDIYIIDGEIKE